MTMSETLTMERVALGDLHPHPMNARQGNVSMLVESLTELTQYAPITVNRGGKTGRPNEILAGHHLVKAASELGWPSIAVAFVDVDDELGRKIMLMDNRSSDLAGYDERALAELLASLDTLDGTGYSPDDLHALEKILEGYTPTDEDDQDILDRSDEAMWPEVRAKLPPLKYEVFQALSGGDDTEKLIGLLP